MPLAGGARRPTFFQKSDDRRARRSGDASTGRGAPPPSTHASRDAACAHERRVGPPTGQATHRGEVSSRARTMTLPLRIHATTDPGHHHPRNEDACAVVSLDGGRAVLLVVCDGRSSRWLRWQPEQPVIVTSTTVERSVAFMPLRVAAHMPARGGTWAPCAETRDDPGSRKARTLLRTSLQLRKGSTP